MDVFFRDSPISACALDVGDLHIQLFQQSSDCRRSQHAVAAHHRGRAFSHFLRPLLIAFKIRLHRFLWLLRLRSYRIPVFRSDVALNINIEQCLSNLNDIICSVMQLFDNSVEARCDLIARLVRLDFDDFVELFDAGAGLHEPLDDLDLFDAW